MITSIFSNFNLVAYIKGSNIIDPLQRFYYDLFLCVPLFLAAFLVFLILFLILTHLGSINSMMKHVEEHTRRESKNIFYSLIHKLRNIDTAAPLLFICMIVFGCNLYNDIWYHDHFGLDGFWAPTHWVFYAAMPVIGLIMFGQTVGRYKSGKQLIFWMWLGSWLATVSMITNFIWHGFELVETFIAPPHVLFFPAMFLIMYPFLHIFLTEKKGTKVVTWKDRKVGERITLFLCFLAIIIIGLGLIQWTNHAEDIGISGFVSLARDFKVNHPNIEIQPALVQVDALRKTTPFLIPLVYALMFSILSSSVLKLRVFPFALTLIFGIGFSLISIFHFEPIYIPVILLPLFLLEAFFLRYPKRIKSHYFPILVACFTSLLFYTFYYPYSYVVSGIHWNLAIAGQVIAATFFFIIFVSWLISLLLWRIYRIDR